MALTDKIKTLFKRRENHGNLKEKTMKEVKMTLFSLEGRGSSGYIHLGERLNFLRNLPIKVYIDDDNSLRVSSFERDSVVIAPHQNRPVSYTNYIEVSKMKDCEVELKEGSPAKIFNKELCGGTYYYFHTKLKKLEDIK